MIITIIIIVIKNNNNNKKYNYHLERWFLAPHSQPMATRPLENDKDNDVVRDHHEESQKGFRYIDEFLGLRCAPLLVRWGRGTVLSRSVCLRVCVCLVGEQPRKLTDLPPPSPPPTIANSSSSNCCQCAVAPKS